MSNRRVAVLLGAGASAEAGLPLTRDLARSVISVANESRNAQHGEWKGALNFVYGSMVSHRTDAGGDPLTAVDIEQLISAVRLLRHAESHEVAPFVAAWKPGARGYGTSIVDSTLSQDLAAAVQGVSDGAAGAERALYANIATIARHSAQTGNSDVFAQVEANILDIISGLLTDVRDVSYLSPLGDLAKTQAGGLDVITLNYDLTVEGMAAEGRVDVYRGIVDQWHAGMPLNFQRSDSVINLYKLHGSLDWQLEQPYGFNVAALPPTITVTSPPHLDPPSPGLGSRRPWIVVGSREKLATEGPTLSLLRAAEFALAEATHLVVVGYSFGDAHINAVVRDWMLAAADRSLILIDPSLGTPVPFPGFRDSLIAMHGPGATPDRTSRVRVFRGTAGDSLRVALDASSLPWPDHYIDANVDHEGDHLVLDLTLLGPDLYDVILHLEVARRRDDETAYYSGAMFATVEDLRQHDGATYGFSVPTRGCQAWKTGDRLHAVVAVPSWPVAEATLKCSARRLDLPGGDTFSVPFVATDYSAPTAG